MIMLGVAALVTAILFASIVFGEYRISQAVKELTARAEEVKQRFPRLAEMEKQARKALAELEGMFTAEEWLDDRYERLGAERRQQLLSVEHLIVLEFAGPTTAAQLRGMANFYESKYTAEKLPSDLDRAVYYALMAADRGKYRFPFLNDLGLIYMDLAERNSTSWQIAEDYLIRSKSQNAAQQRCYYNLGIIYFRQAMSLFKNGDDKGGRMLLKNSRDQFAAALKQRYWEVTESKELTCAVHYNLACCLCRLATPAHTKTPEFDDVAVHLEEASKYNQTKRGTWKHDIGDPDGDLQALNANPDYRQAIKDIQSSFERTWANSVTP